MKKAAIIGSAFFLVSISLVACGNAQIPATDATPAAIPAISTLTLPSGSGMQVVSKDIGEALKSGVISYKVTPRDKFSPQALQGMQSCNSSTAIGDVGIITIHHNQGFSYLWAVQIYQPAAWYSYDYTVYTNSQVHESNRNWFAQPSGEVGAPLGFVITITSTAYGATTAYGTLQCQTTID